MTIQKRTGGNRKRGVSEIWRPGSTGSSFYLPNDRPLREDLPGKTGRFSGLEGPKRGWRRRENGNEKVDFEETASRRNGAEKGVRKGESARKGDEMPGKRHVKNGLFSGTETGKTIKN